MRSKTLIGGPADGMEVPWVEGQTRVKIATRPLPSVKFRLPTDIVPDPLPYTYVVYKLDEGTDEVKFVR